MCRCACVVGAMCYVLVCVCNSLVILYVRMYVCKYVCMYLCEFLNVTYIMYV